MSACLLLLLLPRLASKLWDLTPDANRVKELKEGYDKTFEVENRRLDSANVTYTYKAEDIGQANFHIITVPTPITNTNEPDISYLIKASETVGKQLKAGDLVVYESTVYPGCTEDDCIPVLEAESKLTAGQDFYVGYSPERINPGDPNHRFETILKIVSAQCPQSLKIVADTYGAVVDRRHLSSTINQSGRGCQSHRKHPARSQYRVCE